MWNNGKNYRLTKHGRRRYIERIGPAKDPDIILDCIQHPRAIWRPDRADGFRLVTILPKEDSNVDHN
jgi:hypothetical protein